MLKTTIIGNLTKDPQGRVIKNNENEITVVNFTIAANHGYGDNKRTDFIRVTAWRALGDNCMKYLHKGSKVYVTGTPYVNAFVGKDGRAAGNIELELEEIEFLSSAKSTDPAQPDDDEDIDQLL